MDNYNNTRLIKAMKTTTLGLSINFLLAVFKFYAGIIGMSKAIIADAIHTLSDITTDIVVILGLRMVNKPIDKTHDYGHGKFETLITTMIALALLYVGIRIFDIGVFNVTKAIKGNLPPPAWIAFYAAVVSFITKECLYRYTLKVGGKINSQAIVANAWHHRSDAFSSLATMLGIAGAIVLGKFWRILDPISAILVSFLIIKIG
ncbi:MAG: cation diffusion facilitator family transporter, partial [Candidatus Omnitrophica bacterium]|nr:cation diffusion facilitator family transporter [Candidatus Omnitrophota bacterium]